MNNAWRIVETEPLDADENMALDEAIFNCFCDTPAALPVFRIYQWDSPAFSIGASQIPGRHLDLRKCRSYGISCVRRMTGGGIIFHDREITYSLVIPKAFYGLPKEVAASFKKICEFIMIFYRRLGLSPAFAVGQPYGGFIGEPAEFCFAGREKYDIVIGGKKIGGNAQKRCQKAVFQHGSIPLSIDRKRIAEFTLGECAKELSGATALNELSSHLVSQEELISLLKESFIEAFSVSKTENFLKKEELLLARKLKKEKYSNDAWNIERITDAKSPEKAGVA
mgnify:FL=1